MLQIIVAGRRLHDSARIPASGKCKTRTLDTRRRAGNGQPRGGTASAGSSTVNGWLTLRRYSRVSGSPEPNDTSPKCFSRRRMPRRKGRLEVGSWSPSPRAAGELCQPAPALVYDGRLMITRVIFIVLDSVGIGELPDAAAYGDQGSDTLGNISRPCRCGSRRCRSLGLPRVAQHRSGMRRRRTAAAARTAAWPRRRRARIR